MPPLLATAAFAILVGVSFFFALAESALLSLGTRRARELKEQNARHGEKVARLAERPEEVLATIVLGNTLANGLIVALVFPLALGAPSVWWTYGALFALLLVLLLLGEVMPKALAVRNPVVWSLRVAPILNWSLQWSSPIRRQAQKIVDSILKRFIPRSLTPMTGYSADEYADLIELAHQQGALAASEKEIILQILSMDSRTAKDVMRPRAQVILLPDDLPLDKMIEAARASKHHRIPLFDESPDNIIGILNTRTLLLGPEADLFMATEFPSFVPESINLLKLFEALQRQRRGLAVVLDEYGSFSGLVTLEDILEGVIGPIRHEGEPDGLVLEKLGASRWRAHGATRIRDFRREYPALGEIADVETLGGLVVHLAEVVPQPGEVFHYRGLKLTVKAADEKRVRELLIETQSGGGS